MTSGMFEFMGAKTLLLLTNFLGSVFNEGEPLQPAGAARLPGVGEARR